MLKINKNKISDSFDLADNPFKQGTGLMFRNKVTKPMIFPFSKEKRVPLHMWFVFTSIDVLYLDSNKKIIEIKQDFKPFTYYSPENKAKYIIELPKKSIKEYNIKLKQVCSF